ncbi:LacI family DNA-binding transcriptional regulator [Sphingomonas sp. Root241]|uniref:LacI family DNA-binding transcriptional regulator n=1 Tax=Sphingomonas sp. Root241 TaxID=1736501 RepID=UPI0006F3D401|nr:LacI family DNA-binding transcriptional regulator [Sphingomonas sp. Root241]KRC79001.1 LacI family transcriptional regulator [Sphingomonas sp. Root241]
MQKKGAITIKHVAAEAGVSFQTVSRVINDGPNVTPAMRERVMNAVNKLGYVPSLAARRLGGSRSYLILAFNDRRPTLDGWESRRGNDWVDQMLYGGMIKCAEHGYRMLFELVDSHSDELETQVQAAISALHPDGVILTPPHSDDPRITELLHRNGLIFARLGSRREGEGFAVYMDDEAAARAATKYLLDLGHTRIAYVEGHPEYAISGDRLRGFRGAIESRGLQIRPEYLQPGDFTYEAGQRAMAALAKLDQPPTAVLASSDEMALGVLHAAAPLGFSVPGELSIVSFDDTPTVRMSVPSLTAIRQPIAAMTSKAAELLIQAKIKGLEGNSRHLLPFDFIVRDSTAPPR